MVSPTVVAAGIGAVSSIFGGHSANQANRDLARDQMNFERRMSNTAMQRRVRDLYKAGLSPLLAYSQGGGAGASTPTYQRAEVKDEVTPGVTKGIEAMISAQQVRNMKAEEDRIKADTNLSHAKAVEATSAADVNRAQVPRLGAEVGEIQSRTRVNEEMVKRVIEETNLARVSAYTQSAMREKLTAELDEISARITKLGAESKNISRQTAAIEASEAAHWAQSRLSNASANEKAALLKAMLELATNDAYRSKLSLPHWENMSNAELTTWKQVFAPHLQDMGQMAQSAGAAYFLQRISK